MSPRNRITIADHSEFRQSLIPRPEGADLDDDLDDMVLVDPYVSGPPSRRSDKELARMLDLIDNLPISDSGREKSQ